MGSETRPSDPGLMQALHDKPHAFSFFQAVQLLQRYLGGASVGGQASASEESLRLKPAVSMSFPAADLLAVEVGKAASTRPRYTIVTSFLGLYSSDSPLPTSYTEDLFWKENRQDAVRDFIDIFHHRALSLFYRAWEKYRFAVQFRHQGLDEFSRRVYSLIGLGTLGLVKSTGLPSVRLLHFAGLIARNPHSAAALTDLLREYFSLPDITIKQCVERWVRIESSQLNHLGKRNCALGRTLTIGGQVRDMGGKFRVVVGPLALPDFFRFLPVSTDYAALINLTRFYVPDRLDFDIELKLLAKEAPPLCLSSESPLCLGWTSCLPKPSRNPSVMLRQPVIQLPQRTFQWPQRATLRPAEQSN
jgi:type VI secretion system protein ImpH